MLQGCDLSLISTESCELGAGLLLFLKLDLWVFFRGKEIFVVQR